MVQSQKISTHTLVLGCMYTALTPRQDRLKSSSPVSTPSLSGTSAIRAGVLRRGASSSFHRRSAKNCCYDGTKRFWYSRAGSSLEAKDCVQCQTSPTPPLRSEPIYHPPPFLGLREPGREGVQLGWFSVPRVYLPCSNSIEGAKTRRVHNSQDPACRSTTMRGQRGFANM